MLWIAGQEFAELAFSLAATLARQGAYTEAEGQLRELLTSDSEHPEALLWLGRVCMNLGRFDEAVQLYRRGVDLKPSAVGARVGLLQARGYDVDTELVEEMRQLTENGRLSPNQAGPLNFTLARALDAEGRYEEAFRHFERGNRLQAAEFDPEEHRTLIDRIISTFSAEFFATRPGWGNDSRMPILILGMPRSGTTLVEQILASHPDVTAGGELAYLGELSRQLAEEIDELEYPEAVAAASKAQVEALGQEYLRRLTVLSKGLPRVTDKLPHNFMRLGLVALSLPAAKVIHLRRHPLDTCLSIYFQNFDRGHAYSWDLSHLGGYYREYERLLAHWRRVSPLKMLELQYEELVANQEQKTRELLEFCGLPWDSRCLRFWETERAVNTASLWQVRQPMYSRSVERWRHYETHLGPLKKALGLEEGKRKD